jgi:hypothetical protein
LRPTAVTPFGCMASLGLGCFQVGPVQTELLIYFVHEALQRGLNHLDLAPISLIRSVQGGAAQHLLGDGAHTLAQGLGHGFDQAQVLAGRFAWPNFCRIGAWRKHQSVQFAGVVLARGDVSLLAKLTERAVLCLQGSLESRKLGVDIAGNNQCVIAWQGMAAELLQRRQYPLVFSLPLLALLLNLGQ